MRNMWIAIAVWISALGLGVEIRGGEPPSKREEPAPREESEPASPPAVSVDTIQKWIGNLSHEDWKVRDEATKALTALGKPAVSHLEKAARDKDAERASRAKSILDRFESNPLKLVQKYLQKFTCGCCGNLRPWNIIEIRHEALKTYIPDCKCFVGDWVCCQDKPMPSKVLCATKFEDRIFEILGGSPLRPFLKAVKEKKDVLGAAGLLISLVAGTMIGPRDMDLWIKISPEGSFEKTKDGFIVKRTVGRCAWTVTFDKAGKFKQVTREWVRGR
ncbi:MAG: HEAT repeat domain-containing protein [Planctomycetota bacterium]|jgi:hypothetical protein